MPVTERHRNRATDSSRQSPASVPCCRKSVARAGANCFAKCHLAVTTVEHGPGQLTDMSFQDDAVEPLAVESAQHFTELLRRTGTRPGEEREPGERYLAHQGERRGRVEPGRVLPRELGN